MLKLQTFFERMKSILNSEIIQHYDLLIDENNDPVHDPKPLRDYSVNISDRMQHSNSLNISLSSTTILPNSVGFSINFSRFFQFGGLLFL